MPPKTNPIVRKTVPFRDASLIVIASEDKYAVERYLKSFSNLRRVKVEVLPTEDTRSSPQKIFERLDAIFREENYGADDSFWLCIDRDHWLDPNHISSLAEVRTSCRQKGFKIAYCNPCFEAWLLLHFEDLPVPAELRKGRCKLIESRVRELIGGYTKKNGPHGFTPSLQDVLGAIERARATDPPGDFPEEYCARFYNVMLEIFEKEGWLNKAASGVAL